MLKAKNVTPPGALKKCILYIYAYAYDLDSKLILHESEMCLVFPGLK